DVVSSTTLNLPNTDVGPGLARALQDLLRTVTNAALQNATVQLAGTALRVLPSAATPNASITLNGAGATALRLTGAGSFVNVQQYGLGTGATFGAQTGAAAGADGTPPDAAVLIGNPSAKTGLHALRDVDLFNLMAIPLTAQLTPDQAKGVLDQAIA